MKKFLAITFVAIVLFVELSISAPMARAQYGSSCSDQYGYMSYEDYSGYCKCMSGYVFGTDFLGEKSCVSATTLCSDKYGYGSTYDSISNSCGCSYGYVLGKDSIGRTQCITETQSCSNQYGYHARSGISGTCECGYGYVFGKDSLGQTSCISEDVACSNKYGYNAESDLAGKCKCSSGYEFTKTTGGGLECKSCSLKYGLYSAYNYTTNSCGCMEGYTIGGGGQCVEKQNNVYFTLKELDTDEKKAIIRSDYDYRYHLITYNSGCYASSFNRYINKKIVVNLGTDFDLDTWDKIVLQDDNETCDITYKEYADSDTTLVVEPEQTYYFTPKAVTPIPTKVTTITPSPTTAKEVATSAEIKPTIKITKENSSSTKDSIMNNINQSKATEPVTTKKHWYEWLNPFSWFN